MQPPWADGMAPPGAVEETDEGLDGGHQRPDPRALHPGVQDTRRRLPQPGVSEAAEGSQSTIFAEPPPALHAFVKFLGYVGACEFSTPG